MDAFDQGHQALALVVHVAQAFLEDDGLRLFRIAGQRFLAVLVEEEFRVGQAGTQHALIAADHVLQVLLAAVADGDELVQQLPVLAADREITLMVPHRRDDGRLGQGQVFFLELAAQGGRVFHQIGDFFQQVRPDFRFAAFFARQFRNLPADHFAALVLIDDDEVFRHHRFILVGRRNHHLARTQEAVSHGLVAGLHVRHGHRDDFRTEQGDEPAERAQKTEIEIRPAHMVGERDIVQDVIQHGRQHLLRLLALGMPDGVHVIVLHGQVLHIDAFAAGKARGGLRGLAVLEGDFHGRALELLFRVGLRFGHTIRQNGQTARRAVYGDAVKGDVLFIELLLHQFLQIHEDAGHIVGR